MNTMKTYIFRFTRQIIILFVLLSTHLIAQQDAMFTHYMYNTLSVNPAYAGTRDALTFTLLNRIQWVGFDGAPITQTFSMHTPVKNENMGLGFSLINDEIGPERNTMAYLDYAYTIRTGDKSTLSFGIKGGFALFQVKLSELDLHEPNDPAFLSDLNNKFMPNFGFGMYYSREKFYAGFSVPKLLESEIYQNDIKKLSAKRRHYFFIFGTVFDMTDQIAMKPTALFKATESAPMEVDLTANVIFNNKFHTGLFYRTGDAIGLLIGLQASEQFMIGYSYDWSYGVKTPKYNSGSHEVMLRYDFMYSNQQKIRSPRYF
jgi:type IX secretion system PorP/SprF family membrane protein